MATLMIDDCKSLNDYKDVERGDVVARTYSEGIDHLKSQRWDVLLLDHDLGCLHNKGDCPPPSEPCLRWKEDCGSKTGYDIMLWLEENPQHLPNEIRCISWNPVGREKIEAKIKELIKQ